MGIFAYLSELCAYGGCGGMPSLHPCAPEWAPTLPFEPNAVELSSQRMTQERRTVLSKGLKSSAAAGTRAAAAAPPSPIVAEVIVVERNRCRAEVWQLQQRCKKSGRACSAIIAPHHCISHHHVSHCDPYHCRCCSAAVAVCCRHHRQWVRRAVAAGAVAA